MRGHEHQREGHKSSRSGSWEGFEKLKKALEGLATAKGVSQSRISAVAKLAAHYSKFYKHVVHDIEVFVWKAEVEHRLAGLYAIDAIIRQSHAKHDAKDAYIKRFLIRLADTIEAVKHVPDEYQPKVRHVIDEWQKRGIYSAKQIEEAGGQDYLSPGQDENVTPRASPGKLASLLSIIKQKKEEQEHFDGHQQGLSPYKQLHDVDRRQTEETGASYTHQSYDEHRSHSHYTNRREVGGIMGDAPGVPVGSGRIRRAPDDQPGDINDRDAKKARESRWGPPRMDNLASMDRSAPHETSSDREGEAHATSGRSGYGAQAPLLPSSHSTPQRHEEWTGTAPSRAGNAGWPPSDEARPPQAGTLGRHNTFPYEPSGGAGPRVPFPGAEDRRSPVHRIPGTSGEICRNFLAGRCTFGDRCWYDRLVLTLVVVERGQQKEYSLGFSCVYYAFD
ncbi:hypothetical protein PsorP6_018666 [Peronosclerospora sorghi]|nr:hypothetical protein PsorP6_018666 [Peronosclerospora sorghi]